MARRSKNPCVDRSKAMPQETEISSIVAAVPSLEYAATAQVGRGRAKRLAKGLFVAALILTNFYFAVTKWGGCACLQTHMLICQRRCAHYSEPPDRVIFDNDPSRGTALLAQVSYGSATAAQLFNRSPAFAVYLRTGETFQVFADACKAVEQQQIPGAWQLTFAIPDLSADDGWTLFMRERRSAAGDKRLVVVRGNLDNSDPELLTLVPRSIQSASLTGMPVLRELGELESLPMFPRGGTHQLLRLFAGQPDPVNASRFTMEYETPDGRGTVEGILGDEGAVTLKILDGPLAPTASAP